MQHADLSRGSLAESAGLSRMSLAESTHLDLRKNGPKHANNFRMIAGSHSAPDLHGCIQDFPTDAWMRLLNSPGVAAC